MARAKEWQKMILNNGQQFNVKFKYVASLVELTVTVTDRTGRVLGIAKVCRHFYFTFELYKTRKSTGKRKLREFSSSHLVEVYASDVARWIVKNHTPKNSA